MASETTIQLHKEELDLIEKLVDNHFMKTLAQNFEENPDGLISDDFAVLILLRAKIKLAAAEQEKAEGETNG